MQGASENAETYPQSVNILEFATVMHRESSLLNVMRFDKGIVIIVVGIVGAHGRSATTREQRHRCDTQLTSRIRN